MFSIEIERSNEEETEKYGSLCWVGSLGRDFSPKQSQLLPVNAWLEDF